MLCVCEARFMAENGFDPYRLRFPGLPQEVIREKKFFKVREKSEFYFESGKIDICRKVRENWNNLTRLI